VVAVGVGVGMAGGVGVVVLVGLGVDVADGATDGGSSVFAGVFMAGAAVMTSSVIGGEGGDDGGREGGCRVATPLGFVVIRRGFAGRAACRLDGTGQRGPPRSKTRRAPAGRSALSTRRIPVAALPMRWANVTATRSGRSWLRRCVSVSARVRLSIRTPKGRAVAIVRAVTRTIRCALQHPDSWRTAILPSRRRAGPPIAHRKVVAVAGGRGDHRMGVDTGAARPGWTVLDGRTPVEVGRV